MPGKIDKYNGVPTIQEQRQFPKEVRGKSRKGKKQWGIRMVPRVARFENCQFMIQWNRTCHCAWYATEKARNEALRVNGRPSQYWYRYFILEPCTR